MACFPGQPLGKPVPETSLDLNDANSVIGVSRLPVVNCGTTFHLDYGGRDLPTTPLDNIWKLIYLGTEALCDSFEFIDAIEIILSIYLSKFWWGFGLEVASANNLASDR